MILYEDPTGQYGLAGLDKVVRQAIIDAQEAGAVLPF